MIQRKDGEFSLPGLKRHTGELFARQSGNVLVDEIELEAQIK